MDITQINGYKDGMTAEEQLELIKSFTPTTDYSGYVKKDVFDKASGELAEFKRKYNASLSEQEKNAQAEAEARAELENNYKALLREKSISDSAKEYLAMGYSEEHATKAATALADGDMKTFFEVQKKAATSLAEKIKSDNLNKTPTPPTNNEPITGMTKAEFMKLSTAKQEEYIKSNPDWQRTLK